ncbi:hypothetical protein SAMN05216215_10646 [Saccharopolyspora shandongensis]|uniref:Uncharacterized protein n=1 Tax=Saccharopolyspora shandongensis TaxID=418495 RepID=A0A1H3SF84_9PSEU|nr:hypothetical protein [Saccharopolyspora shandongensis]SDZ36358.1 hypothetical protein SAMN05216215_10646 [Saccharopolyspora shandongensis]
MSDVRFELNYRERAALRAVAAGRVEITCSCEPDLFIDGVAFCDQQTAHLLVHEGLMRPAARGEPGQLVAAELTGPGMERLGMAVPG